MDPQLERLIERLPDREAAWRVVARLEAERPEQFMGLRRKPAVLANLMTLAAFSPWLGDVLLSQPDVVDFLARQRGLDRSQTKEELLEELGRYAARNTSLDEQSLLAAFKQRELARIYLRDCLGLAALTETTEELSNLADAVLDRALGAARQQLVNRYGVPTTTDARGRFAEAEFAVVALGKLGSRELNYASDIDLMFLYRGAGSTALTGRGAPEAATIDNHTFFTKLAEALFKTVGAPGKTAPVYRVDLRLRPYGRDGELAVRDDRALEYYREKAQNWERQMLIRARAAAGSEAVVTPFLGDLRDVIYRAEPLPQAIRAVRETRGKIDRQEQTRAGGFNVKLAPGGIREIEFVAQALQLAYGGSDPWIRSPQVLIGLQRLADKGFLKDADRAALSEAYVFLRTVEHRLQMTHGAQTHRLPLDAGELAVLARRCGYDPALGPPGERLTRDVEAHTARVRAIAERVFAIGDRPAEEAPPPRLLVPERTAASEMRLGRHAAEAMRPLEASAALFAALSAVSGEEPDESAARGLLVDIASRLPHPARALRNFERYLASLATAGPEVAERVFATGPARVEQIVRMLGSGAFFAEIFVARPELAAEIPGYLFCTLTRGRAELAATIDSAVTSETTLAGRMSALRRAWYREIVAVGAHDVLGGCSMLAINREQTYLAEAALRAAFRIALEELAPARSGEPRVTIGALGRLGHAGMDYGSDLDLLVVFDGDAPSPVAGEEASLFYQRFAQLVVRVLSSLTRDGYVYRVDFRLRPEGRAGRMASSLARFAEYVTGRASPWELTAYLKIRPVAGDAAFGDAARAELLARVFDAAAARPELREELRALRFRTEREVSRGRDVKAGRGGMMDVYFVTRYVQLASRTDFPPELGTRALIEHLGRTGVLEPSVATDLYDGYTFLRRIDHELRLIGDRRAPSLPEQHELLEELANATGFTTVSEFDARFADVTARVRDAFERVFG